MRRAATGRLQSSTAAPHWPPTLTTRRRAPCWQRCCTARGGVPRQRSWRRAPRLQTLLTGGRLICTACWAAARDCAATRRQRWMWLSTMRTQVGWGGAGCLLGRGGGDAACPAYTPNRRPLPSTCNPHTCTRALPGLWEEALDALQPHVDAPQPGTAPVLHYTRAFIRQQLGQVRLEGEQWSAGETRQRWHQAPRCIIQQPRNTCCLPAAPCRTWPSAWRQRRPPLLTTASPPACGSCACWSGRWLRRRRTRGAEGGGGAGCVVGLPARCSPVPP